VTFKEFFFPLEYLDRILKFDVSDIKESEFINALFLISLDVIALSLKENSEGKNEFSKNFWATMVPSLHWQGNAEHTRLI